MFATFKMDLPDCYRDIWEQCYKEGLEVYSAHKQKN